jgi:hypothetical protein
VSRGMNRGANRGILSERPVAKILLVLGVLLVLVSLLAGSSTLTGIGWAAILASAIVGAFFNA